MKQDTTPQEEERTPEQDEYLSAMMDQAREDQYNSHIGEVYLRR